MAIRVILDDTHLQNAAIAIQEKDNGPKISVPDFASRIRAIAQLKISETSDTPICFGADANGFYFSDNLADASEFKIGRTENRIYVEEVS